MKVTTYGIVFALKNLGTWLASYTVAGIKTDPQSFVFALTIYALVSVPTDLLLLNHLSESQKPEVEA